MKEEKKRYGEKDSWSKKQRRVKEIREGGGVEKVENRRKQVKKERKNEGRKEMQEERRIRVMKEIMEIRQYFCEEIVALKAEKNEEK